MTDDPNAKDPKDKDSKSIPQSLRDAWLSVLGVFTTAEAEVNKRIHEAFGVPEGAQFGAELMARVRKNREEFERRVDEGVKSAIAKVRAPIDKELATMKSRVERIQARIEEQKRARAEKKKPAPKAE